jgi:LacI family transcriptional regulator
MQEVARHAGVSSATVSRVLNGNGRVRPELRRRVEQSIAALGYRPNQHARRLRGKRSGMIGLIFTDALNPFFAIIAVAIEDVARQNGYTVVLGNTRYESATFRHYLDTFLAYGVDGLVVVPSDASGEHRTLIERLPVPCVVLDQRIPHLAVDQVASDNVAGARQLAEHLLDLGHRRIAFVGGDPQAPTGQERVRGYRLAHEARGVPVDESLVCMRDFWEESAFAITAALLARTRPDALFAANLNGLVGTVRAVRAAGLAIPGDIAVVGFDDIPFMSAITPFLTVVAQQSRMLGVIAAQLLLDKLGGRRALSEHQTVLLQPELLVRESCGAGLRAPGRPPAAVAPGLPEPALREG